MLPQVEETLVGEQNITYKLIDCISTTHGPVCQGLTYIKEPCLLQHSINICLWTLYILQNFNLLYEIEY